MAWGSWLVTSHSLEAQARIAIHRQEAKAMPPEQLRALTDSLIVLSHNQDAMLRAAMKRIAELEVKHALMDVQAAAAELSPQPK